MGQKSRLASKERIKSVLKRMGLLSYAQRAHARWSWFLDFWLPERLPDAFLRMDTARWATRNQLGLDPERSYLYLPSPWPVLKALLKRDDVSRSDTFVDFGCGKGRVVYLAARYPFGKVIGVEISEQLSAIARSNLARNRGRLECKNVEIVTSDALDFDIPDSMTVAYFFSPFPRPIFEGVVDRILASIERTPRPVRLIYLAPEEHELVLERGFREVKRVHYHSLCFGALYLFDPATHKSADR